LWSGAATLCLFLSTISGLVARLIRIAITAAAYEAMPPRCPFGSVGYEAKRAGRSKLELRMKSSIS
jgi:hypothetical protein